MIADNYDAEQHSAVVLERFESLTVEDSELDLAAKALESSITGRLADRKQLEQEG